MKQEVFSRKLAVCANRLRTRLVAWVGGAAGADIAWFALGPREVYVSDPHCSREGNSASATSVFREASRSDQGQWGETSIQRADKAD